MIVTSKREDDFEELMITIQDLEAVRAINGSYSSKCIALMINVVDAANRVAYNFPERQELDGDQRDLEDALIALENG